MALNLDLNSDFSSVGLKLGPFDVIIVGGGPGGTFAAIYTARSELRTLVIDKGLTAGALGITSKISNYPGVPGTVTGADLVETMRVQAQSFGAEFITDKVVGVDLAGEPKLVFAGTNTFETKAIILATGSMGRTNVVKGESELLGHGVSYCATCDGAFFRDQTVAVIGNNDEAPGRAFSYVKSPSVACGKGERQSQDYDSSGRSSQGDFRRRTGDRRAYTFQGRSRDIVAGHRCFCLLAGQTADYRLPDGSTANEPRRLLAC
jgi:glycine/D-amino acid oxidase-like deaminating enzyme